MNWIVLVRTVLGAALLAFLAACGGGGAGTPATDYKISLSSGQAALPLNIALEPVSIGGRYTTTIYVRAEDNNGNAIPGGASIFSCNLVSGLDSGALYYLDGKEEHETTETIDGVEVTTPNAYRAVTLDSNAGAATFHFHATDTAGTAKISCAVTDPRGVQRTIELNIQVGAPSTGKVSQVVFDRSGPNYLYAQGLNGETQMVIQARMVDEAGQPIANPASGVNNIQVRIVPSSASQADDDASLRGVNAAGQAVSGSSIIVRSVNGQAQFTLVSGSHAGSILLEALSDRSDNNVGNGVIEQIYNLAAVPVVTEAPSTSGTSSTPITIVTTSLPGAAFNVPYGALLEATGGSAPYTWTLLTSSLPAGLSFNSTGVISGTPSATVAGMYSFVAKVTDGTGASKQQAFSIVYAYTAPTASENTTPPTIGISTLSSATEGVPYGTVVTASGGATPYTWEASGLPSGLTMTPAGVLSGTPGSGTGGKTYQVGLTVTSYTGTISSRIVNLVVNSTGGATSDTTAPTVVYTLPNDGQIDLDPLNLTISIKFSEGMEPNTITDSTFIVIQKGTSPGVVPTFIVTRVSDDFYTLTPNDINQFEDNTTYTVTVTTAARDKAGNRLAVPFTFEFTTGIRE